MQLRNTADSWGPVSRALHWFIVLLIIFQGVSGLIHDDLPRETGRSLIGLHKSVGITVLFLAVARLVWRFFAGVPEHVAGTTRMAGLAASAGHWLLYGLMFAVPLTGWEMVSAGGRALSWFGIPMPAITSASDELRHQMQGLHENLFWVLVVVAVGHAAVAIWHHVVRRDAVLTRMLGRSPPSTSA